MISENDLAELIFPNTLQDFRTFIALSQVSKRFNEVSKRKLIRKEQINSNGKKKFGLNYQVVWNMDFIENGSDVVNFILKVITIMTNAMDFNENGTIMDN